MPEISCDLYSRQAKGRRLLFPYLLAASALALLVVIIRFPALSAHSSVNRNTGAWNVSKESKAAEAGIEGAGEVPTIERYCRVRELRAERHEVPDLEIPFAKLPRVLRIHYFRPPPQ